MPVILYRDANFGGPVVRLQPGFHTGRRALEGAVRGSNSGEDLSNAVSSVRVDDRYVAVLYNSATDSASSGARTLVGPAEIPDLNAVGMDDKTSAVQVFMYEPYLAAVPRDFGVTLYSAVGLSGVATRLGQGDYDRARLDSDEVKLPGQVQSLCVGNNTLAILYEGNNFESTLDSVAVAGPRCIDDVERIGMYGDNTSPKIKSIRVLYAAAHGGAVAKGLNAFESAVRSLGRELPQRLPGAEYNIPVTDRSAAASRADAAGPVPVARVAAPALGDTATSAARGKPATPNSLLTLAVVLIILVAVMAIIVATWSVARRHAPAQK